VQRQGGIDVRPEEMYKTIMDDDFPDEMTIRFGDQTLLYKRGPGRYLMTRPES